MQTTNVAIAFKLSDESIHNVGVAHDHTTLQSLIELIRCKYDFCSNVRVCLSGIIRDTEIDLTLSINDAENLALATIKGSSARIAVDRSSTDPVKPTGKRAAVIDYCSDRIVCTVGD